MKCKSTLSATAMMGLCAFTAWSNEPLVPADATIAAPTETEGPAPAPEGQSIFEMLTHRQKSSDAFNLYLDTQFDFNNSWTGNDYDGGKFRMAQLRIEFDGNVNSWISYRFRMKLNKGESDRSTFDNVMRNIDFAQVGFKLSDKFGFVLGKQCVSYGGYEYDLNPIDVYEFVDQLNYTESFLTGVRAEWQFAPDQQLQMQVVNSLDEKSEEMYGNLQPAKLPLLYALNWNGRIGEIFHTRWSASFMNETKGKHKWYFALGNDFRFSDRFDMYVDWMYSIQDADRNSIITEIVGMQDGHVAENTAYNSVLLHTNYYITKKWNIFAKGSYETADVRKTTGSVLHGNYRTTWGYEAGVEFYPLKDQTLHFFAVYVGRNYKYSQRAMAYGHSDYNTNRISVGFAWKMPVY